VNTTYSGPSLGNDLVDISPDFEPHGPSASVIQRIVTHAKTPEAITAFSRECHKLSDYCYWFTLGTLWVDYTEWSDLQRWKWLFSSRRPNRQTSLMKPSEFRQFVALPDGPVHLFRAHRPGEDDWISYTLDLDVARRFAAWRSVAQVHVYKAFRRDMLCLFTRRLESEVLILDRRTVTLENVLPVEIGGGA